jgi:triosephosphate isomerase
MRRPLVAGNWKMNTSYREAEALARGVRDRAAGYPAEVVLCPPFVWLDLVRGVLAGTDLKLGAQDVFWEESGPYTGEVSASQLRELCDYVIVGHSERRALFGETDEVVRKKCAAAVAAGLVPILAVGEGAREYEAGRTDEVVRAQLRAALPGVAAGRLVIAYEPVWAIGRGEPAAPDQAQHVAHLIRDELADLGYDAGGTQILYGGSISPATFGGFVREPDIDGALAGGASLHAEEFSRLVEIASSAEF